ncbi:MAG: response regulator [Lachnospiraceae bacterium]|nr:response regulator [Lachnospiraceae bacterium]MDY4096256.1 response regulator [Lachnospiraceae bacterium]
MDKYKILLVDDERQEREGISFLIERYGYPLQIKQAVNGQKALEMMKKEEFDILFTDVKMPVMDGLTLAREVAQAYPKTIIIIFSAYSEFNFARKAMEAGVVNYLLKPVEIQEFQHCMEGVINKLNENRIHDEQDRENQELMQEVMLYGLFRTGKVPKGEREVLRKLLFEKKQEGCIPIVFEFVDNYFEHSGELFQKMAGAYFREITFVELLPNEAYLVIESGEYKNPVRLKEQLEKLLKALGERQECLVVAGETASSMDELITQLVRMDELRKDIFGYGDRILFVREGSEGQTRYARAIEEVKSDIFSAIERQELDRIREGCMQLRETLSTSRELSRIYIQHLLYSIVKELYDKIPQVEYEDALAMAGEFFSEKKPEKVLSDFSEAVDRILSVAGKEEKTDSELILRIKNYIQKDYQKDLSLVEVAREVGLAPAYVSHTFKKETGQGIVEYITELKMKKARKLLEDKSLKIVKIAQSCGYENQSYFNKLFKSYYGMTPRQYREGLR